MRMGALVNQRCCSALLSNLWKIIGNCTLSAPLHLTFNLWPDGWGSSFSKTIVHVGIMNQWRKKKESNAWNCSLPMTVKLCQQCEKWPKSIVENFPIPCRAQFFNTRNTFPYFTHHHNSVLEDPNKLRSTCCRPMTRSLGKKVIMVLIERNLYIMTFFAVSHLWIANFSSCWVEACYRLSDPSVRVLLWDDDDYWFWTDHVRNESERIWW